METYFSKSGAKSAALDSFVNPVTYRVFLGMLVVFLLERKTLCVCVGGTGVWGHHKNPGKHVFELARHFPSGMFTESG